MLFEQPTANTDPAEDRRKRQRVGLRTQVESRTAPDSSLGRAVYISVGGLLVQTSDTFDAKTGVTIRFNLPPLPPGRSIECQGVVVRVQPGVHMGIEFLQLKDDHRKATAEFVQASLDRF